MNEIHEPTLRKDIEKARLLAKSKDFSPPLVAGYDFVCLVARWLGGSVSRWVVGWLVHGSASTTSRCPRASAQMILGIPTSAKHGKYHFQGGCLLEKIGKIEH